MINCRKRLRYLHKKKPKKPGNAGRFHHDMTAEHFENVGVIQFLKRTFPLVTRFCQITPAPPGSWFGKKGCNKGKGFIELYNKKNIFFTLLLPYRF